MKKIPNQDAFWRFDIANGFCMNVWGLCTIKE